ncbi:MAG: HAD family hydrolase [Polyangiales bacterium]
MRLLQRYPVLLFDMHGVLMFGHDRFGEHEDFFRSYRALGGTCLSARDVDVAIRRCFAGMRADYDDPARFDDFPSVREGLARYARVPESELSRLEIVFALHECGLIPDACAAMLARLARSHRLGLVSDVWAPKYLWQREFERAGISDLFTHTVFSSDTRSIKPSSRLFREGLRGLGAEPSEALFVGDSLMRDIEGAKRLGIRTVWISEAGGGASGAVDYVLRHVTELETLEA